MIDLNEIHSLSDFQRNAREHIERLKKTGRPQVLTVNGKAEVVVQDAASYQKLLDLVEHAETIAGIRRGLDDISAGRTRSAKAFLEEMQSKLGIPGRS